MDDSTSTQQPKISTGEKISIMLGMSADVLLQWVNTVYFGALIIAAVAGMVSIVAGMAQNNLNNAISAQKDRNFAAFKQESDLKIAQLNLADAQLTSQNLKLEAAIAPRRLGKVDSAILQKFSGFFGQGRPKKILLTTYILDQESFSLALQIFAVFIRAGGGVQNDVGVQMPGKTPVWGVIVYGTDTALVKTILDLLRSGGLPCRQALNLVKGPTRLQNAIPGEPGYDLVPVNGPMAPAVVFVGLKPLPDE